MTQEYEGVLFISLGPKQTLECTRQLMAKQSRKQDKKNKTQGSQQGK